MEKLSYQTGNFFLELSLMTKLTDLDDFGQRMEAL